MTAEGDLDGGGEPSDLVLVAVRHQEGGLGEVVLCGDRLQHLVGRVAVQHDDCSRVPGEPAGGERIDLKNRGPHGRLLSCCGFPGCGPGGLPGCWDRARHCDPDCSGYGQHFTTWAKQG